MRLIEFIKANLPLGVCSQLQGYFHDAETQSTTSEEEGYLLGNLLKEAHENNQITEEAFFLVKKVAAIHRGSKYFLKEPNRQFSGRVFSLPSPSPEGRLVQAGLPK